MIEKYLEKIKNKVDCEGWMHSMYFTPEQLGFSDDEVDYLLIIDCWRPKDYENKTTDTK